MLKVNVEYLKPGMTLAKSIVGSDGQIFLQQGIQLKKNYIDKLSSLGISSIYIDTHDTSDIIVKDVICEQNRMEAKKVVREAMKNVCTGKKITTQEIFKSVHKILDDLLGNRQLLMNLSDIKAVDDYTFAHSVNVCVLSLIMGIAKNYNRERLHKLGVGALLHDIGKVKIPKEILNKPSKLTDEEFDIIKSHTTLGYEIVKEHCNIASTSAMVVLTHHERFDGTGYPLGKENKEIHEFSRIVSIADVYDALTSDRVYKKKILPHQAIEYLVGMGNHQFDYEFVKEFVLHVASYPIGTIVMLNTGDIGVVTKVNAHYPNRPKIRVLMDKRKRRYIVPMNQDLCKEPSLSIIQVLENIESI